MDTAAVLVTPPSHRSYEARVSRMPANRNLLRAEFIPREVGRHLIQATINDLEVQGSPFTCEVYDVTRVHLHHSKKPVVGQLYEIEVDCMEAGLGDLDAVVRVGSSHVTCRLIDKGHRLYKVTFMPKQASPHSVYITFCGHHVPGCPFSLEVEDTTLVDELARALQYAPLKKKVTFHLDPAVASSRVEPKIRITGPSKHEVPHSKHGSPSQGWQVTWLPHHLGLHSVAVKYKDRPLVGSPFKCKVYDLSKVRIIRDLTSHGLNISGNKDDVIFHVDASQAGAGNLEVVVRSARDGSRIPNFLRALDQQGRFKIYFTPKPGSSTYDVDVAFNEHPVMDEGLHGWRHQPRYY